MTKTYGGYGGQPNPGGINNTRRTNFTAKAADRFRKGVPLIQVPDQSWGLKSLLYFIELKCIGDFNSPGYDQVLVEVKLLL